MYEVVGMVILCRDGLYDTTPRIDRKGRNKSASNAHPTVYGASTQHVSCRSPFTAPETIEEFKSLFGR